MGSHTDLVSLPLTPTIESWAGGKKNIHDVSENRARIGYLQLRRPRRILGKSTLTAKLCAIEDLTRAHYIKKSELFSVLPCIPRNLHNDISLRSWRFCGSLSGGAAKTSGEAARGMGRKKSRLRRSFSRLRRLHIHRAPTKPPATQATMTSFLSSLVTSLTTTTDKVLLLMLLTQKLRVSGWGWWLLGLSSAPGSHAIVRSNDWRKIRENKSVVNSLQNHL